MQIHKLKFLIPGLLISILGLIPRSIEVIGGNFLFGFDQGAYFLDVKRIVIEHKLTLIGLFAGGGGGLFQGPGWYYLLSIPFVLTEGNPMAAMVLMLILGLLTIVFSIYFSSRMYGLKTALVIGFLIAISPALIPQSRFIWAPFPISLITVFYLFFLFNSFKNKGKSLPLATLMIGLMSSFELASSGTLFFQYLVFSLILLYKKIISVKSFLLSLVTFSIPLLPLIFFNFKHNNILVRGLLNVTPSGGQSTHQVTRLYIERMLVNHFDNFRYGFLSSFYSENFIWLLIIFITILGTVIYIKDKKVKLPNKWFLIYLISSPLTLYLIFAFYLWPIWQWWILELIIFYNFAFGIILVYLWKRNWLRPLICIVLLYFVLSFVKDTIKFYKGDFHDYGGTAKIKGKEDAIGYIYKDAGGKKFNLLVFSPPVYTFPYDYLLWWYGQKKYGFIPGNEKKGTFYLLIEPDPSKPWSYKGWLETVIKTGNIIKTVELPSGFIVQKRQE